MVEDSGHRNSQLQKLSECIDLTTKQIVSSDILSTSYRDLNSFYLVFISLVDLFFGDSVTLAQILKPSDTIKPTTQGLQSPSISQTVANERSTLSISREANNSSFQHSSTSASHEPRTTSAIVKMLPSSGDWLRQIVFTVHSREQKGLPHKFSLSLFLFFNACNISYLHRLPESMSHVTIELLANFLPNSTMFDVLSRLQGGVDMKVQLLSQKSQMFLCLHSMFRYLHPVNSFSLLRVLTRDTAFHLHNQVTIF